MLSPNKREEHSNSLHVRKTNDNGGTDDDALLETKLRGIMDKIPRGYFIGLSQQHTWLICCVLYYIFEQEGVSSRNSQCVLDIGSGKGYIDRILSSYYKIGVFCVEAEKERLESSTRLQRLLNDDKPASCDTPISGRNSLLLMRSCQYRLRTDADFYVVWERSISYFRQLGTQMDEIVILALKVCGDMFYDIVDWVLTNYKHMRESAPQKCRNAKVFIVPCCLEKSTRLRFLPPASGEELQQLLAAWVKQQLADMSRTEDCSFSVEARKFPGPTSYFGIEMNLSFPTETVKRACPR